MSPNSKKVFIKTFGCQMNDYDSGKMRALLAEDGYEAVANPEEADLILVNTCSVRERPELKLHSFIGEVKQLRRADSKLTIGISGCMAQHDGERLFKKYRKDVDLVFGPDQVPEVRALVARAQDERVLENDFRDDYTFVQAVEPSFQNRISAFVTIQKGCDNKCTFCIVPATRGGEISRPPELILQEIRDCVARGAREVTLLGQNVNSYGLKAGGFPSFAQLLYKVAEVPGLERIRYTSPHPRDMGPDVLQAYRDLPTLTAHIHLPVQSGSSRVLRRMKRFYSRERYLALVDELREARPGLALSTDIITGFPGETDADFEETMTLLEAVRFDSSFSFFYNPRPNTPALRLEQDDIPVAVRKERLMRYQTRQREIQVENHQALEGTVDDVLVEGPSKWDEAVMCGRTSSFRMINFPGELSLVSETVPVTITRGFTNSLRGERA